MTDLTRSVCIFRKRLLAYSETFIADQARYLPTFASIFSGFKKNRSGIELLGDAEKLLLEDFTAWPEVAKIRLRLGFAPNADWLGAIAARDPDLLHAHFLADGVDAIRLGKLLSKPVVATIHGHDITKRDDEAAERRRRRFFFDRIDRVIAVSDFIASRALAQGCPEQKLVKHYIGIDIDKFSQPREESEYPSLLFVGRLVEKKGCTYLLQAMERLQARFPELRLTVVGDGDLKSSLQREAGERRVNAEFAGTANAEEIRRLLARSWVFVAPSVTAASGDAEGLGMVFLEAQALQTPVVSFRSGGLVEAVEEGRTALLSEERDVDGLAANIADLLDNSALRHNMGVEGRKRVEQHFDIRKQCAALEAIYEECS